MNQLMMQTIEGFKFFVAPSGLVCQECGGVAETIAQPTPLVPGPIGAAFCNQCLNEILTEVETDE